MLDDIIRYEAGEMNEDEVLDFFQELVNTGLAWSLQGSYGRTAATLLKTGAIEPAGIDEMDDEPRDWTEH
jgi:hypothetical protein